jgi:hypothetical protein
MKNLCRVVELQYKNKEICPYIEQVCDILLERCRAIFAARRCGVCSNYRMKAATRDKMARRRPNTVSKSNPAT